MMRAFHSAFRRLICFKLRSLSLLRRTESGVGGEGMTRIETVQRIVYRILDPGARESPLERAGNLFLGLLIPLNVLAVVVETVEPIRARWATEFAEFEAFSVAVFTVEYLLRLWTSALDPRFGGTAWGRLRFIFSPMALIDLIAIVPAYLPGDPFLDLRYARVMRLVRMLRTLKMARYSRSVQTFSNVFRERRADLVLITVLLVVMLVVSASTIYFAEHAAQPRNFSSIPAAMWWAAVTLTTVGYGDIYPITPLGKFLGGVIALLGIGLFALPAGILASGFADELQRARKAVHQRCPHCNGELP
jgi:voltage-gated potassium channel